MSKVELHVGKRLIAALLPVMLVVTFAIASNLVISSDSLFEIGPQPADLWMLGLFFLMKASIVFAVAIGLLGPLASWIERLHIVFLQTALLARLSFTLEEVLGVELQALFRPPRTAS